MKTWLNEVLEALLPVTLRALEEQGPELDEWSVATTAWTLLEDTLGVPVEAEDQTAWRDTEAEIAAYAQHVTGLAADPTNPTAVDELPDDGVAVVTSIGTGRGPANAGLAALAQGHMRLFQALIDDAPTLQFHLDGPAHRRPRPRRDRDARDGL